MKRLLFAPCLLISTVVGLPERTAQFTLVEGVGQLIIAQADVPYRSMDDPLLRQIRQRRVGAIDIRVRISGPNLLRIPGRQLAEQINEMQREATVPLLIGSDIERGLIARVQDAPDIPTLMAWGASDDSRLVSRIAELIAKQSRAVGIRWTFAPVVDINDEPANAVIGDRSFGSDAMAVSRLSSAYIRGAHSGGLLTTAKHFPGHGEAAGDSHVEMVTLDRSLQQLREHEFLPFKASTLVGTDAIILAHLRSPALDSGPRAVATTSAKTIRGTLRTELGFHGLIVTDALAMHGLLDLYRGDPDPLGRAAVEAIKAGADMARELGMGKLGKVAIDSTRIKASASRDKLDTEQHLRDLRAQMRRQVRRWQQMVDADDADAGGLQVAIDHLESKLAELPQRLERLKKSGLKMLSRSGPDARLLRTRSGFDLDYTAEIAVSDDHLIVAQRVTQNAADNASLLPMVEQVRERCGQPPGETLADSGFFSIANLQQMEARDLDAYVPDSNLARSLNLGVRCRQKACAAAHKRMRRKLKTEEGRPTYGRRKAIVEPVFGVMKQQRGMRQFRTRGIEHVGNEWALAATAYNLTRLHASAAAR